MWSNLNNNELPAPLLCLLSGCLWIWRCGRNGLDLLWLGKHSSSVKSEESHSYSSSSKHSKIKTAKLAAFVENQCQRCSTCIQQEMNCNAMFNVTSLQKTCHSELLWKIKASYRFLRFNLFFISYALHNNLPAFLGKFIKVIRISYQGLLRNTIHISYWWYRYEHCTLLKSCMLS